MKKIFQALSIIYISIMSIATASAMTTCKLSYKLRGWSFIYQEYKGSGHVHCKNGQSATVRIVSRGGGLSIGKSEIYKGKGVITEVYNINEIYGTYIGLNAHAGATKSVEGHVMTKGEISLALGGRGRGFDLGITLGAFTIRPF